MGLAKRSEPGLISQILTSRHWLFAAFLMGVSFLVALLGEDGRLLFRYEREAIAEGQFWRFLTAHFAHLGFSHMILNMLGLALIWALVGRSCGVVQWVFVAVMAVILQSTGFWLLDPGMQWYVGMSGTLHGFLVAGAMLGLRSERTESIVLLILIVAKLLYEQLAGPLPGSEATSGGNVVVNAHLYGAIGGAIAGAFLFRSSARPTSI